MLKYADKRSLIFRLFSIEECFALKYAKYERFRQLAVSHHFTEF